MSQAYRHANTSVTLINYHFVFVPRRRRKVLIGTVANELKLLLREKTAEINCTVVAFEVMPDHVHLFLNCPPSLAPDAIMFRLKGYTSRILRQRHAILQRMPSLWTRSYFCSTAGNVSTDTIRRYIANQKTR